MDGMRFHFFQSVGSVFRQHDFIALVFHINANRLADALVVLHD